MRAAYFLTGEDDDALTVIALGLSGLVMRTTFQWTVCG
jgi:hypothetical protein